MKIRFGATLAALTSLAGCQSPSVEPGRPYDLAQYELRAVAAGVRASMKDPESAKFGSVAAVIDSSGGVTVCGYVNGKNSFGGYTGEQRFIGLLVDRATNIKFAVVAFGGTDTEIYAVNEQCAMHGIN